MKHSIIINKQH